MRILLLVAVLVSIVSLSVLGCEEGGGEEEVALEAARDWTHGSIKQIGLEIGGLVMGEAPILKEFALTAIAETIRNQLTWKFSTPVKKAEDRYEVVATASASARLGVAFVSEKDYDISADFVLDVDTSKPEVVGSQLDLSTLSVTER